ncbi:MAG: ubiquinol-cytochrome c reductase iron-sulfur subunit [Planctomycetes bacterium]|nr:ubiquinol-cytochrome c reductase iron-sulfur subunit [Planctomycetota bacterium]
MLTAYPPQAGAAQIGAEISRRDFTALWLKIAWGTFAAGCGIGTLGSVRFMFPNVSFEPPLTFKAGFPRDFAEVGKVYEQFKEKYFTWLIREESGLYALSTTCTHLGCTPNWLQAEQKFKCPCHGSGFRKTGINFEGPAPRPLERWRIAFAEDGQILVDKGKKFQFEKGEWVQSDAFLKLS